MHMRNKRGLATKLLTGSVVAVAAAAGLVAGVASPALADPTTTYVFVGSDTTQDVMNGIAGGLGGGFIGSWDAVNPVNGVAGETINVKPGCQFSRPNGSGDGLVNLRISMGSTASGLVIKGTVPPVSGSGCIDGARSSSGPGNTQNNGGVYVYIPFALDAVAAATGPAAAVGGADPAQATQITQADSFTLQNLKDLYAGLVVTVNGVAYDGQARAGNQPIHLYAPQAGSGTRSFWATTLQFNGTTLPAWVHDQMFVPATGQFNGAIVEEHDGTVFANDPLALGPFSIAQQIAQSNAAVTKVRDRRHNVALHNLNGVTPKTGNNLNASFPITREVFNILPYAKVVGAGADPNLVNIFVGAGSVTCGSDTVIHRFGFASIDGTTSAHTCGATSNDLRALTAS
jgi:ABC-type phosphate transport system substrate-binding protein